MERNVCARCVMDRSASEIVFDENGVCNFCHQAVNVLAEVEEEKFRLPEVLKKVKGEKYDCLIGFSV